MTGVTAEDRLLHVMPLHHTNGVNNQLIVPSWPAPPWCWSIASSPRTCLV